MRTSGWSEQGTIPASAFFPTASLYILDDTAAAILYQHRSGSDSEIHATPTATLPTVRDVPLTVNCSRTPLLDPEIFCGVPIHNSM